MNFEIKNKTLEKMLGIKPQASLGEEGKIGKKEKDWEIGCNFRN